MAKRRKFTTEQKVAILRRHLMEKAPISELRLEKGWMAGAHGSNANCVPWSRCKQGLHAT
jgi:hypothetical protein